MRSCAKGARISCCWRVSCCAQPYWPLHAARALGHEAPVPNQYLRAFT